MSRSQDATSSCILFKSARLALICITVTVLVLVAYIGKHSLKQSLYRTFTVALPKPTKADYHSVIRSEKRLLLVNVTRALERSLYRTSKTGLPYKTMVDYHSKKRFVNVTEALKQSSYRTSIITLPKRTKEDNHPEKRPLLVDVTEAFLSGHASGIDQRNQQSLNRIHKILWYNKANWLPVEDVNHCLKTCVYSNCESDTNVTKIRETSAVIFDITNPEIGKTPPIHSTERPMDQAWAFFAVESPIHLDKLYSHLRPVWINSFNWSMNYRLDSDIIIPYGYLTTRNTLPERNYKEIFRTKTKFAAWVVSNCYTVSGRERFVEQMKNYGLEIDIYGDCGQALTTDPKTMINNSYKFYLGFENSFCSDYITEKFFGYYNLNTVMIVRGGGDYRRLLPQDTYIDTANFQSVQDLVNFLENVGSNEKLYIDYLKRKDKYHSIVGISTMCPSFCALCRKLNNLDTNRRVYETIPTYSDTCHKPNDIDA